MTAAAAPQCGMGLRQPHYAALLTAPPPLAFVEVHSENFYGDGGAALAVLHEARGHWPVSLHGVGLGLGSAVGIDGAHLERLASLAERIDPVRISDHACFARAPRELAGPVVHGSDLLPIAFTEAALQIMVDNVGRVQERLGRSVLVENLSSYLRWSDDALPEPAFFNALTRRSGCGLLLDVNNLVVNALNAAPGRNEAAAVRAACDWIDAIDAASVGEIHLAGYDAEGQLVIDDHGSRVHVPVWRVFDHALQRIGPRPTLIEWDTDVPALEVLLAEVAQAESRIRGHR
ncbi:MAG: DUF692 domain-containing protein [Pseudomonadota bacterium]|nr:DUF692 domain-containing protein [Pseudomonadota bacterium]